MKEDQEQPACQTEEQGRKHRLFGYDPAPLVVLTIFLVLFLEFVPDLRIWLLALIVLGVLVRLALAFFQKRG